MRAAEIGLAGLSYVAGPVEPLAARCAREGLDHEILRQMSLAGLRAVAQSPENGRDALAACMGRAIAQAGVRPDEIAAICFAPPSFDWSRQAEAELVEAAAAAGFRRLPMIGVGLQGCGAIGAAVEVASGLVWRKRGPVLIALSALAQGAAGFDPRSMRLFGHGAACAMVVPGVAAYRVLGTTVASDLGLARNGIAARGAAPFQDSWQFLRAVLSELIASAESTADDIAFVCGSNVNAQALATIAMAAGIARDRVWAGGLAELGHLYSADALIALARLEASGRLWAGDRILVVGWSEWTVSGVIVEYRP